VVETSIGRTLLRVHRNWLVNTDYVKELEGYGSETKLLVGPPGDGQEGMHIPVARERAQSVRAALLGNAMGIRPR
jgi:DNA-binding LytR/AlgR family response regulator